MVDNETKSREQLIRELRITRAQLALEIERNNSQLEVSNKLIQNLKDEMNIIVQRLRAQVVKRKNITASLETQMQKHRELSQNIEKLSKRNVLELSTKTENSSSKIRWFENFNLLKSGFAS